MNSGYSVPRCRAAATNLGSAGGPKTWCRIHLLGERKANYNVPACGVTQGPRRKEAAYDGGL
jgi:hypothetical protein